MIGALRWRRRGLGILGEAVLETRQHLRPPLVVFLLDLRGGGLLDVFEVEGKLPPDRVVVIGLHLAPLLFDVLREQLIVDQLPFVVLVECHRLEAIDLLLIYLTHRRARYALGGGRRRLPVALAPVERAGLDVRRLFFVQPPGLQQFADFFFVLEGFADREMIVLLGIWLLCALMEDRERLDVGEVPLLLH